MNVDKAIILRKTKRFINNHDFFWIIDLKEYLNIQEDTVYLIDIMLDRLINKGFIRCCGNNGENKQYIRLKVLTNSTFKHMHRPRIYTNEKSYTLVANSKNSLKRREIEESEDSEAEQLIDYWNS